MLLTIGKINKNIDFTTSRSCKLSTKNHTMLRTYGIWGNNRMEAIALVKLNCYSNNNLTTHRKKRWKVCLQYMYTDKRLTRITQHK